MINTRDFHDVKLIGDRFSWYGKRYNHDVHCCLDRVMENSEWIVMFFLYKQNFYSLKVRLADHWWQTCINPLTEEEFCFVMTRYVLREKVLKSIFYKVGNIHHHIRSHWVQESVSADKQCQNGNTEINLTLQSELKIYNNNYIKESHSTLNTKEISRLHLKLQRAYKVKNNIGRQKAWTFWLHFGDQNTKYFYASAKQRLARNRIIATKDYGGNIQRGDRDIGNTVVHYFTQLFKSTKGDTEEYTQVFDDFQPRVTDAMNAELTKTILEEKFEVLPLL